MPLFSLLQMGASSSRTTCFKMYFLKNWNKLDLQSLKRHALCSVILNGHSILWKMGDAGQLKGLLIIITVLQLDWLCKKKKKKKKIGEWGKEGRKEARKEERKNPAIYQ